MTETPSDSHRDPQGHGTLRERPPGACSDGLSVLFLVFLLSRRLQPSCSAAREHQVLARADRRSWRALNVAVIHATPVNGRFRDGPARAIFNSYVDSPIYARTNGYLKKWYKDIGSHVNEGDLLAEIDTPEVDAATRAGPRRSGHRAGQRQAGGHHRRRATRTCSRAMPCRSRKWTTSTATTPPSRPWCNPRKPT